MCSRCAHYPSPKSQGEESTDRLPPSPRRPTAMPACFVCNVVSHACRLCPCATVCRRSHHEGVHFDDSHVRFRRVQDGYGFVEKLEVCIFEMWHTHWPANLLPQLLSQIDVPVVLFRYKFRVLKKQGTIGVVRVCANGRTRASKYEHTSSKCPGPALLVAQSVALKGG